MNRALWLLIGLQMRGWLRYLGHNLRTVRGALLALVGGGVVFLWLLTALVAPAVAGPGTGIEASQLTRFGPGLLLAYCVVNVVFSSHERAIYFSPAEVLFLFPGPFTRRQVLAYKILLTLTVTVPASLLMSAVIRVKHGWWPGTLAGLALVSIFMQLFGMALGLIANALGEHLYSRGRWVVVLGVAGAVGLLALHGGGFSSPGALASLGGALLDSAAYRYATAPLEPFFELMRAERLWPDLLVPLGRGLAVLGGLLVALFALDAHYLEASASASARLYARVQRLRGRQVTVEEPTRARVARLRLPALPYWGGIGPIFWRQLVSGLRGLGRFALVLVIVGVSFAGPLLGMGVGDRDTVLPALFGLGVWLSIFLTSLVPFDFRGDIDRMGALKVLPIVPWRLSVGQLLTPTLLLSGLLWLSLAAGACLAPAHGAVLAAVAAYVPFYCFLLVAIENLLFLLFPVRIMAATPGDFQAVGRNVLLALGKLVALGIVLIGAFLAGLLAYLATGGNVWAGAAAGWVSVVLAGAALVPLVSLAFQWFDVGRDTPA